MGNNIFSDSHKDKSAGATIQQTHIQNAELENYAAFAFWALVMSYFILYGLVSASIGKVPKYATIMMGIKIWTMLMMVFILISSFIRLHPNTRKVVRVLIAGSLFVAAIFMFCLLQLTL